MDHERFKNVASGIQSLMVVLAIVVGGIWSLYTFGTLRSMERAQAEVDALNEISLTVVVAAEQVSGLSKQAKGLIVTVTIENTGKLPVDIDLSKNALRVVRVASAGKKGLRAVEETVPYFYSNIESEKFRVISSQAVQPHSKKRLIYFAEVSAPGIYWVGFVAPTGSAGERLRKKLVGEVDTAAAAERLGAASYSPEGVWIATTFIDVK